MECTVCDYTGIFDDPSRSAASPVTCKFVLLQLEDKQWLVIGRLNDFAYHAMLVHRFSKSHGLNIRWVKFQEMAEFETERASILGGGWIKFDLEDKSAKIYGSSTAYGAAEHHLVAAVMRQHPEFGRFSISL